MARVVDDAKAEAKKQGKQVEIPSLHTENMTTVANPDGKTVGTYVYNTPVRFKDSTGNWQAIDTTLVRDGGVVRPKAVKDEVKLSGGGNSALLAIKTSTAEAQVASPRKLPTPTLSGNAAKYSDAFGSGIDLVIETTPGGIRQKIIIKQRPTVPLTFHLPIKAGLGLQYRTKSGTPQVLDAGKKVADVPAAVMLDAATGKSLATGAIGAVDTALNSAGTELIYKPDAKFLTDNDTVFPVTLAGDPTPWFGPGFPTDTFVATDSRFSVGTGQQSMDGMAAGRTNFDGASAYYVYRSYVKFDLSNAPFYGMPILNADMRPTGYNTTACGAEVGNMIVRRVTSDWALNASDPKNLRWDNQPTVTTAGQGSKGSGVGQITRYDPDAEAFWWEACPAQYASQEIYYSIEGIVQDWANGAPNYGLQVSAESENAGPSNYREYLTSEWTGSGGRPPVLFVEYEAPAELDAVYYTYEGEDRTTPPTYDEAIQMQAKTVLEGTSPAAVTPEEFVLSAEERGETPNIIDSDLLPIIEPTPDTTPPAVISTEPTADANSIPLDAFVRATFDEDVSNAQLIVKDPNGNSVAGTVISDAWMLTFTPSQPLAAQTTFTAEVSGATDLDGNVMATPFAWSFVTRALPVCTAPTWSATTSYSFGALVTHNGHTWQSTSMRSSLGAEPGVATTWADQGGCNNSTPTPTPTPTPPSTPTSTTRVSNTDAPTTTADDPIPFSYDRVYAGDCIRDKDIFKIHRNVFNWCYTHFYGILLHERKTKAPVGWIQFRATSVLHTRIGSRNSLKAFRDPEATWGREISVSTRISQLHWTGDTSSVQIKAKWFGNASGGSCYAHPEGASSTRIGSLSDWSLTPDFNVTYMSTADGNSGPAKLSTCTFSPFIEVQGLLGDSDFDLFEDDTPPSVRCDTAPNNLQHFGGCIFDKANRIFSYDTQSSAHGEVAQHIWSAFYTPHLTDPTASGKEVPGNIAAPLGSFRGKPLHRTTDGTITTVTDNEVGRVCRTLANVPDSECDEYPFNSSWEGAGRAWGTYVLSNNFSARRVNSTHNSSAGTSLGWFYWRYRVMNGDPFWMVIKTNGQLPRFE